MNWIRSLKLSRKLLLISVAYFIPIATLVYCTLSGVFAKIHFTEQESAGNRLQRTVMPLLQKVTARSAYLQAAGSDTSAAQRAASLASEIDSAWGAFEQTYNELSSPLQFTSQGLGSRNRAHLAMQELKGKWQAARDVSPSTPLENVRTVHRTLTDSLNGVIAHLGDTSNLILDPELDSYYLMDVTLLKLPQSLDRASEATLDLLEYQSKMRELVKSEENIEKPDSSKLATSSAFLTEVLSVGVKGDLDTALTEDARNHGEVSGFSQITAISQPYYDANTELASLLKKVSGGDGTESTRGALAAMDTAQAATMALWTRSVDTLDLMLNARKGDDQKELVWALVPAVISYLFAGILVFIISRVTAQQLTQYTQELRHLGEQVTDGVNQISAASHALAQATSEQAASLEETAASLQHILSVSTNNTENCQKADSLALGVQSVSESGSSAMEEMSSAMVSIKGSADETAGIVRTIDDIAFQTNLLALNAAVEAARAGETGKGFAVVAEEVRRLAQRSADAAKDTSSKIMRSLQMAENGVGVSASVRQSLQQIRSNAVNTASIMREIATATKESTSGINQITTSMSELDKVTQSNSASAEELAAAGSTLQSHVDSLGSVIQDIQSLVTDSATEQTSKPRKNSSPKQKPGRTPASTRIVQHEARFIDAGLPQSRPQNGTRSLTSFVAPKAPATNKPARGRPEDVIPLDADDLADF